MRPFARLLLTPVLVSLATLFALPHAHAQDNDRDFSVGIAPRVSTQGIGGEIAFQLRRPLNLRLGAYGFSTDQDLETDGIEYTVDIDLVSAGAYLDFHPFSGFFDGFKLSAGVLYSGNGVSAVALPGQTLDIGDLTFGDEEVGTLSGTFEVNDINPYLGFGWGNFTDGDSRFFFALDLGVMFHGTPQVTLTSTGGTLSNDPILLNELAAEQAQLQEDVDAFDVYPVVSLGIGFRF